MPRDAKKDSSDFYNDDLITLEQYIGNSLLRDGNLTKTIFNLKQEAEKFQKAIDWGNINPLSNMLIIFICLRIWALRSLYVINLCSFIINA